MSESKHCRSKYDMINFTRKKKKTSTQSSKLYKAESIFFIQQKGNKSENEKKKKTHFLDFVLLQGRNGVGNHKDKPKDEIHDFVEDISDARNKKILRVILLQLHIQRREIHCRRHIVEDLCRVCAHCVPIHIHSIKMKVSIECFSIIHSQS